MEKGQKLFRYETTKITLNIPTKLKNRVWKYSYELGLPMTQTIVLLLNQALDNKDVMIELPNVVNAIRDLKEIQYKDKNTTELV